MPSALRRTDLIEDLSLRGRAFAGAWTDRIESWLVEVYAEAVGDHDGLALVAIGGQGRREMAPHSDLDLLLLTEGGPDVKAVAQKLWYPIWDAGLKLGHSVRSVRDTLALASEDLETATSLLSARHIIGDADLTAELSERARANWRKKGRSWLAALALATDERHREAGEVAFSLEPDLKEARGGLRDVHALGWAAAAGAAIDPSLSDNLEVHHDVLLEVRVELHRYQGRPGDRLVLQEQAPIAAILGDADDDALMARVAAAGRAIAITSDEAWHDIKVNLDGSFFGRFRRDRAVAENMVVRDARVCLLDEAAAVDDPFAVLRVAGVAAREQLRISAATLEALAAAPAPPTPWGAGGRVAFCELLLSGPPAVPVIEILEQRGLWTRLLPEWAATVSRPQRNAYHRFTVDRHLLETASEAAALAHTVPRPDLLVMGALLHDIAKAYPEHGDHSEHGAEMAAVIARRMGFEDPDVATIVALVRHHLLLPDVATRRDVSDPATAAFVAAEAGSAGNVVLLRALTEADSLATGTSAWSPWKAELVDSLASHAVDLLDAGGSESSVPDSFPSAEQRELLRSTGVGVLCDDDRITVSCDDQPGVFSRVAGALALHGLDVVAARIHSEGDRVLDEFRVRPAASGVVPWARIEGDVVKAVERRIALEARLEERARSLTRRRHVGMHQFEPAVRFDNGESTGGVDRTVVEVVGPDSIGLLYRLARSLSEFNLDVVGARIDTIGHDVVDSFYVTSPGGGRIEDEQLQAEISMALLNALDPPTA